MLDQGMLDDGVLDEMERIFARCGARGFVSASEVGRPENALDLDGDEPVVAASVIKIVVALAFARAVCGGRVDPERRVLVPPEQRVGGSGTAGCVDPVQMSLRDLALFMMSMSDNAATDIVYHHVGPVAIDQVCEDLELTSTHLRQDMRSGARGVVAQLGLRDARDLDAQLRRADEAAVRGLAWLDPGQANVSTAHDTARLLDAIWSDRAGPPDACAMVRGLMSHQIADHRLASGFPGDDVVVASKTGTLPSVRNEAGVVACGDRRQFVVSVFTRSNSLSDRQPAVDAAIGSVAALAVDHLRGR